ncbi:UNVERIFIED_CONTAM: Grn [Trichonephila clavipes]
MLYDETCCPGLKPGEYSCCQFPGASCCQDMEYCCPRGTICEPDTNTCTSELDYYDMQKRFGLAALKNEVHVNSSHQFDYCDGQSYCFESSCCPQENGQFGCCPFKKSVCCPDQIHCCPYGEICDVTSRYCVQKVGEYYPAVDLDPARIE